MFANATSPEVVRCLCLWLRLVGAGLQLVEVRQLLPVVVLVLVGVVVVGAHDVVGDAGGRLLRPRGSEGAEPGGQSAGGGGDTETRRQRQKTKREKSFLLVSATLRYDICTNTSRLEAFGNANI